MAQTIILNGLIRLVELALLLVPYFISIATAAERFNITNTQLQVGGIMYARDTQVFYILGYDSGEDEYFTNLVPTGDVRILDSGTTLSTVSTNQIVKVQAGTYAGRVFTPTFDQSNVSTATDFSVTFRWTELGGGSGGERNFTSLTDTPTTYSGQGGQIVAVNSAEDALEFIDAPSGGGGTTYVAPTWQEITRSSGTDSDGVWNLPSGRTIGDIDLISVQFGTSTDKDGSDTAVTSTTRNNDRVFLSTDHLHDGTTNQLLQGVGAGASNYAIVVASTTYTNTQLDLKMIDMNNGATVGQILGVKVKFNTAS